jgi:hypothetical protein
VARRPFPIGGAKRLPGPASGHALRARSVKRFLPRAAPGRGSALTFGARREQSPDESSFSIRKHSTGKTQPGDDMEPRELVGMVNAPEAEHSRLRPPKLTTGTGGEQATNESALSFRNEGGTPQAPVHASSDGGVDGPPELRGAPAKGAGR